MLAWAFVSAKYNIPAPSGENLGIFAGGLATCLFSAYVLVALVLGKKRAHDLTFATIEKVVRF
jgi:hypothetical protein